MFVMLFGLMGVAAIMPVGNHYAARSDQYDRGSALAGSAFAELKSRGLLQPQYWLYSNQDVPNNAFLGDAFINPTTEQFYWPANPGHAFVIDPLGASDEGSTPSSRQYFPFGVTNNPWASTTPSLPGAGWPIRRMTLPTPRPGTNPIQYRAMSSDVADTIFRLHDDLNAELPDRNDQPGIQLWQTDNNGTPDYPADDILLSRAYAGSYSWLATVLPVNAEALAGLQPGNPRHGSFLYQVSVAVFRKRDDAPSPASERLLQAELGAGGNLVVYAGDDLDVDEASLDIRAGNWLAIAGVHPTTGKFLLSWYRMLAYDDETNLQQLYGDQMSRPGRRAMLEGPEWPTNPAAPNAPAVGLRAILIPNVLGVATQTVKLETN
jgi:hypothetical protein